VRRAQFHPIRNGAVGILVLLLLAACAHEGPGDPGPVAQPTQTPPAAMQPPLAKPPVALPPPPEPLALPRPFAGGAPPVPPVDSGPQRPSPAPTSAAPPERLVSFRFEEAELETVLRAFIDLAGINVVLAPGVKAKVTLWIDRAPASQAFAMLQAVLEAHGLVAIKSGPVYKIVPVGASAQQATPISIGKDGTPTGDPGFVTQIVPLQFLTSEEVAKVLQPLAGSGRVQSYRETNTLIISAPASLVKRMLDMIQTLDVPGQQRETQQLYVYYLENAKAPELATTLSNVFGDRKAERPLAPVQRDERTLPGGAPMPPQAPRPGVAALPQPQAETPIAPGAPASDVRLVADVRIVADPGVNALIIRATPQDYRIIEQTLKKMDVTPKQVLIEALVAEITLTDDLSFGLEWFLKTGSIAAQQFFGLGPAQIIKGVGLTSQGFTLTFVDQDRFALFLNSLSKYTKVNTLSTPHVLTQNNHEAKIQVGQQVPVVTGTQATVTSLGQGGQDVFQTIQQQDIGRILTVKPHVNEKRQVSMEIQLEVTDVLPTSTVNGTPSFSKRAVNTSVVVEDRQSLLIGGIISAQKSDGGNGIPWLSRLPILGFLFGETTKHADRTELFIMLTPRVVGDPEDGRKLTEDFRTRLDWLEGQIKQIPQSRVPRTIPGTDR
jgi:general secretion pathway protein D